MSGYVHILHFELLILLLFAVISDMKTYKIKNSITYSFILLGVITNIFAYSFSGLGISLSGAIIPVILLITFFIFRMLGAGDIKLFSAIGAIMGIKFVLFSMVYSFICGGVIALLIMLFRKNSIKRLSFFITYLKSCLLTRTILPYTDFEDKSDGSKMHFSYAVACGTAVFLITRF